MKAILLSALLVFLSNLSFSQVTMTFDTKESCILENGEFDCLPIKKVDEMMKSNPDETMFTHVHDEGSDAYYVTSTDHTDEGFVYYVTGTYGDSFVFMIQLDKNLFKISKRLEGDAYGVLIYTIASVF